MQSAPPCCGTGLVHVRSRFCDPPPHVKVHVLHAAQSVRPPSTVIKVGIILDWIGCIDYGIHIGDQIKWGRLRMRVGESHLSISAKIIFWKPGYLDLRCSENSSGRRSTSRAPFATGIIVLIIVLRRNFDYEAYLFLYRMYGMETQRLLPLLVTFVSLVSHPKVNYGVHEQAKDFYISPGFLPSSCSLTLRDHGFLLSPKRTFCINNKRRNAYIYLFALIILTSNDCHPNPGPRPPKFPCNICSKANGKKLWSLSPVIIVTCCITNIAWTRTLLFSTH